MLGSSFLSTKSELLEMGLDVKILIAFEATPMGIQGWDHCSGHFIHPAGWAPRPDQAGAQHGPGRQGMNGRSSHKPYNMCVHTCTSLQSFTSRKDEEMTLLFKTVQIGTMTAGDTGPCFAVPDRRIQFSWLSTEGSSPDLTVTQLSLCALLTVPRFKGNSTNVIKFDITWNYVTRSPDREVIRSVSTPVNLALT